MPRSLDAFSSSTPSLKDGPSKWRARQRIVVVLPTPGGPAMMMLGTLPSRPKIANRDTVSAKKCFVIVFPCKNQQSKCKTRDSNSGEKRRRNSNQKNKHWKIRQDTVKNPNNKAFYSLVNCDVTNFFHFCLKCLLFGNFARTNPCVIWHFLAISGRMLPTKFGNFDFVYKKKIWSVF